MGTTILIITALVIIALPVTLMIHSRASEERKRDEIEESRQEQIERRRRVEDAVPLFSGVTFPDEIKPLMQRALAVREAFESLSTFQDADRWDHEAGEVADGLMAMANLARPEVTARREILARYVATTSDEYETKRNRAAKAQGIIDIAEGAVITLDREADSLLERIEVTPNNKKDQRTVLRGLRAEKKELAIQKRETRGEMADVHRETRLVRAGRAQREAAIAPHEDAVSALERQAIAIERRIAWVKRFGDEAEGETELSG
jgi:hypothetical protein